MIKTLLYIAISICFLGPVSQALSETNSPFSGEYVKYMDKMFSSNGRTSFSKIDAYISLTNQKRKEHLQHLVNYYRFDKGYSLEKAQKKAESKKRIETYNLLLKMVEKLKSAKTNAEFYRLADVVLNLSDSIKTEGPDFGAFLSFLNKLKVTNDVPVASNLYNEQEARYYTPDELEGMGDTSMLDPVPNGAYWIDTEIENYEISNSYNPRSPLYRGVAIPWPREAKYDDVRKTQSTPKLDIEAKINGVKYEYKIKFGAEIYSEPVSAALFSALGFNTDPTKHVKNFKMYLGKTSERDFRREFASYYQGSDIDRQIARWGEDSKGRYVIFKEALLEAKPKENVRVGPWSWGLKGKSDTREVRALNILNVWVGNKDTKEALNNKLIIKNTSPERPFYVSHDLGWGYGKTYIASADTFSWDAVKSYDRNSSKATLNMYLLYKNSAFDKVSYDDARWVTRRIARLSKKQIADAVALGGWPEGAGALIVEKMANRRNQLVEAFGLSGEFKKLSVDRKLSLPSGSITDGKLDKDRLKDLPNYVAGEWDRAFADAYNEIEKLAVTGALSLTGSAFDQVELSMPDLLGGSPVEGNLIVGLSRNITTNREPIDANDRYIVKDRIRVGFALGVGYGIKGKLRVYRDYKLYYGVKDNRKAHLNTDHILAVINPFKAASKHLPERYTLVIEDYIEGEGSIKLSTGKVIEIRPQASISRVNLNRLLVADKGYDTIKIYKDDSVYTDISLKLKLALQFIEIDFLRASFQKGKITRNFWEISTNERTQKERLQSVLAEVRRSADTAVLGKIKTRSKTISKFRKTSREFNLLNVVFNKSSTSKQDIEEWTYGDNPTNSKTLQLEMKHEDGWTGLYQSELRQGNAFFVGTRDTKGRFKDPVLGLNIFIEDKGADSRELAQILKSINVAANDYTFMPISPSLHSRDGQWGTVWAYLDILIYKEGIETLLNTNPNDLWHSFYRVTSTNDFQWRQIVKDKRPLARVYDDFMKVTRMIKKAQNHRNFDDKMKYLVKAMRKAFINTNGTIKSQAIAAIMNVLDEDQRFIGSRVTSPFYEQTIFPSGKPMVNQIGELRHLDARLKDFDLENTNKVYNLFDSDYLINTLNPSNNKINVDY